MKQLFSVLMIILGVSVFAHDDSPARVLVWTEICEDYNEPIYGMIERPASNSEVLSGLILGGAIGNQFGSGSGKDAMTVLGVIVGVNQAGKRKREKAIVGYKKRRRCHWDYI